MKRWIAVLVLLVAFAPMGSAAVELTFGPLEQAGSNGSAEAQSQQP